MNKKILVFPGSFDPIHIGHIQSLKKAIDCMKFDRKILLYHRNKFKFYTGMFKECYQWFLIEEGLKKINDDVEFRIENNVGSLYIVLKNLFKEDSDSDIVLLIGDDVLIDINKWHLYDRLRTRCTFIISKRMFKTEKEILDKAKELNIIVEHVIIIDEQYENCSSTKLRKNVNTLLINNILGENYDSSL